MLPAEASAKVDFRLVPNQTPEEVLAKLHSHLDAEGFSDVQVTLMGGEAPGRVDPDDPFIHLTVEAARGVFEHEMVVVPMIGGSGPNHAFIEHLHVPIATVGFGQHQLFTKPSQRLTPAGTAGAPMLLLTPRRRPSNSLGNGG